MRANRISWAIVCVVVVAVVALAMSVASGAGRTAASSLAPASTPPPALPIPTPTPPVQAPEQPAVKAMIGASVATPARPIAGQRFIVSYGVARSDSGAPLTSGTVICNPTVAGKLIPHAESFRNGTVTVSSVVPKTAKGKLLKVGGHDQDGWPLSTREGHDLPSYGWQRNPPLAVTANGR